MCVRMLHHAVFTVLAIQVSPLNGVWGHPSLFQITQNLYPQLFSTPFWHVIPACLPLWSRQAEVFCTCRHELCTPTPPHTHLFHACLISPMRFEPLHSGWLISSLWEWKVRYWCDVSLKCHYGGMKAAQSSSSLVSNYIPAYRQRLLLWCNTN